MQKPFFHDTIEYLDQIVQIIDSEESKNFIDTSLILAIPIICYNPITKKYLGYDTKLINDALHYYYYTPEYANLTREFTKSLEFFEKNMTDLINIDFIITPTIQKELIQTKTYKKDKRKSKTRALQNIKRTKKRYTTKYQKNGEHKAKYVPKYGNIQFSREKEICNYINQLLTIEHKIARDVKKNSLKQVNELTELRIHNLSLYQKIYASVNYAFERLKEHEKDSPKNQDKSKDPKILSEIILYSHIFGEKINFFTADSDFYRISKYLDGKWIRTNIKPEVTIVQRMMQKKPQDMPYFKKLAKIIYNNGFIVER